MLLACDLACGSSAGYALESVAAAQGLSIAAGDVVLCAWGYLSGWPDPDFITQHKQAGVDREAGLWLADEGVVVVGGDNESPGVPPSTVPRNPHPVHIALLVERGIFTLEMVNCEELARDRVYDFCFVCPPLSIRGTTGSMVRPVAVG